MYTILICDDDEDIVSALKIFLSADGYKIVEAFNGEQAIEAVKANDEIQLILMDVMMPGMSGVEAMIQIRSMGCNVPIILLTAKSEDSDKILGLNCGADDYITKPYNTVEVMARVRSQLRRYIQLGGGASPTEQDSCITNGSIVLNNKTKIVTVDGEEIKLTPTEFEILRLFMEHPEEVFSLAQIYKHVWNDEALGSESTVAVHIRHLREKIEIDPADPKYIKVVWAQGYKMKKG